MFKFIDLFCGIGGFRIALEDLGGKCVFSSDWDKEAQKTYYDNFKEKPEGDITKVPESDIPIHDVLCAGFPCQPFSISGKQKGFNDVRGTLFHDIVRIANFHQPKYLFLENVANMLTHDNGNTLRVIKKTLDKINYNVYYDVLNASLYGVPQARKRIYFICVRKDIPHNDFKFIEPTYEPVILDNILLKNGETKNFIIKRNDIHITKRLKRKKRINKENLKPIRVGYVNKGGQGERIYSPLGHSITLSAYGGGAGAKTGLYYIDGKIRKLHPEECKRVMTFPESFKVNATPNKAFKQFGNSVAVKVVKMIFSKVMEEIECQKTNRLLQTNKTLQSVPR
jgi:DNA (cytosine-5)-methyltransferase 1